MCLIIDPPLFIPLFKSSDPEHVDFVPVLNWIKSSKAKFVFGGTTYAEELKNISSVLPALVELEKKGKIHRGDSAKIDTEQKRIKLLEPSKDFDDAHLVAIATIAGCKLVCTRDKRSHKYLRDIRFYAKPADRPKLYTRIKNQNLLCNRNMCRCCE